MHLVCTLGGLPVLFALTGAKEDERETLRGMLDTAPDVLAVHPGQTIIGGQELLRPRVRARSCRASPEVAAASPQGGSRAGRGVPVQTAAAGHRVDQSNLQGAAQPGTTRRQEPCRGFSPGPVPDPRTHSGDLAQRPNWTAHQAISHGLRSLTATTPLGLIHLERLKAAPAALEVTAREAYVRLDQCEQSRPQPRVYLGGLLAPADRTANPPQRSLARLQLVHALANRGLADLSRLRDHPDTAVSRGPGLGSHQQPTLPLVQMRNNTPNVTASWSRVASGMPMPGERARMREATARVSASP